MILESLIVGMYQVNCYILADESDREAIIIDPGDDHHKITKVLDRLKLEPKMIINTHGHFDHIGADDKFGLPVYIHTLDKDYLSNPEKNLSSFLSSGFKFNAQIFTVEDNAIIKLKVLALQVIHCPGHTPGSISLRVDDILFSGDTLFYQGVGRTDFPGASERDLFFSIKEKLFKLPDDTIVYPGHGSNTTIGQEKTNNPFVN